MREIKFRAWDRLNNQMVYTDWDSFRNWYTESHVGKVAFPRGFDGEKLELSEPMQFTNLKDKNGKEIYQGDIIEYDSEYIVIEQPRWYVCDAFCVYGYHNLGSFRDDYSRDDEPSRVIRNGNLVGNIYEHRHLLK